MSSVYGRDTGSVEMDYLSFTWALSVAVPTLKYMPGVALLASGLFGRTGAVSSERRAARAVEKVLNDSGLNWSRGGLLKSAGGDRRRVDYFVRTPSRAMALVVCAHVGTIAGAMRDLPQWQQRMPHSGGEDPIDNPVLAHEPVAESMASQTGIDRRRLRVVTVFPLAGDVHRDDEYEDVLMLDELRTELAALSGAGSTALDDGEWSKFCAAAGKGRPVQARLPKPHAAGLLRLATGAAWLFAAYNFEAIVQQF